MGLRGLIVSNLFYPNPKTQYVMKRIGLILITVIFSSISLLSQSQENNKTASSDSKVIDTTVHSTGLENNLLGDSPERNVSIYLPPGYYDSLSRRYPVVYFLHGFSQDNTTWWGTFVDIEQIMNALIDQGKISPMIVVVPNSNNKYNGSWYTNSSVTGNWEDFIVEDVVQFVDSTFRTLPQLESRGIAGHSMGGYGAIKLAMRNSHLFNAVYALSPALMVFEDVVLGTMKQFLIEAVNSVSFKGLPWQAQTSVAEAASFAPDTSSLPYYGEFPVTSDGVVIDSVWQKWLEHDPYTMLTMYKDSLLKLRAIQFDCGTDDNYLYDANVRFSQSLIENGVEHVFESYSGNHTNKISERIKTKMLSFFSANLSKNMLSDTVVIPDTAFLYALIDVGVDTNGDSLISYEEAEAVTLLDVPEKGISDMKGIESFINLDSLFCWSNNISSIDVSNNTALTLLSCSDNNLVSLDVSNNTALIGLDCSQNNLVSLDVSNNPDLWGLLCWENEISTIDISNNPELELFWPAFNQLTSLDVSNNPALSSLNCTMNQLASLDVSANTALELLWCDDNQLTNLNLSNNTALKDLGIGDMPTLYEVCVWEMPFPPSGFSLYTKGSPNVEFKDCSVGIDDYNLSGLTIYPNPTNNLLTIETEYPDHYSIEISTVNGQQILNGEMEGTTHQIDLSTFKKGAYFITIRSNDFVTTRKIIKL